MIADAVQCSSRCTLTDIEACVRTHAQRMGIEVQLFQTSDLGHCIQRLESAQEDAVVINPGRCAPFQPPRMRPPTRSPPCLQFYERGCTGAVPVAAEEAIR